MTTRPRIAVVTDDAAALPPQWSLLDPLDEEGRCGRAGLAVATMPVTVDGAPLEGPRDAWPERVGQALAAGCAVSTSRPSPGHLLRIYRRLEAEGFDGIVSLHCAKELSGTLTSARIATSALRIPVEVVDSRTIAMAQGWGAVAAWEAAEAGAPLEETAEAARTGSDGNALLVSVPTLETLRRGGRIGASTAALGTMLQVRPILRVSGGQLVIAELPRSDQRARVRLVRRAGKLLSESPAERPELVIHHLGASDGARELGEQIIAEHAPEAELTCLELPAVLAAHGGPGCLGVAVRG